MAFRQQLKIRFAGLEEDLDLPAFSINPDNLFFGKIRICTDKGNPVLFILLVTDTDDLCRNLLFFSDQDIYRKQIFAASPALLTDAEYLLDGELLSFVFIVNAGTLFDHGSGIPAKILDSEDLSRAGKPGIKQNIVRMVTGRLRILQ